MKKITQMRAEQKETLVCRRLILTQMSLLQIRLEQSVRIGSSRRRQAATPRLRVQNNHMGEGTQSTCFR